MSTGSAAPPKNSKWDFFKRLQFLEPVSTERPTASNVESDSAANAQFETRTENSEGCPDEASQSSVPQPPRRKRRNNNHDDILDNLVQQLSANTDTEIEDEIASFGNHVKAPRLKIQANILSHYEVIQMDMRGATWDVQPKFI